MKTNSITQYKIIVEEYKDFTIIDIALLSRDQKEPVKIFQGLNYLNAENIVDELIEEYNINDSSKIVDIIYDNDEREIQREEITIEEYKKTL